MSKHKLQAPRNKKLASGKSHMETPSYNPIAGRKSKSSKLLFNKTKHFVEKLESNKNNKGLNNNDCKPAWTDEDDNQFETVILKNKGKLTQRYETLMGTPGWAKFKTEEDQQEDDNEILRTVGHLQKNKDKRLQKEYLDFKYLEQINGQTHTEGPVITCIEFHSKASVALVAGTSGLVSLFSIGSGKAAKLHNFKLKGWKMVMTADILPDGSEAYLSSSKSSQFCVYNLMKGEPKLVELPDRIKKPQVFKLSNDGKYIAVADGFDEVFLLRTGSYELLRSFKHNSEVVSATFSYDNKELYTFGCSGEVTIWDLSSYRPIKKFNDNGCVNASVISSSACGRLLATGSNEGIVNIYQTSDITSQEPLPHKTITNLRTAITHLKFNPTTEILSMASNMYKNAAKLVHIPSYHVFKNFPEHSHNMNKPETMSFSPNCGYMALGNNNGSAYLYRLKHYANY